MGPARRRGPPAVRALLRVLHLVRLQLVLRRRLIEVLRLLIELLSPHLAGGIAPLAVDERRVGGVEQLAGVGPVVRKDRRADARRQLDGARADPRQAVLDAVRELLRLVAAGL